MSHIAYIALGSNLGDRRFSVTQAVGALRADAGVGDVVVSSLYTTDPVGGPAGQGPYLNAAARVETRLGPERLLDLLLEIERSLGRVRQERWGPRTIDLDLLLYDDRVINVPGLTVPHPRMHERRFVLEPLAEIARDVVHPVLGKSVARLLEERVEADRRRALNHSAGAGGG
ncbi:MAG TPA: 2-amino-4-hydroxy-6-hydroxymethyldihydropteridine diphosphokinase [Phycisphaerae bacterium]|nr:2-amino-4-hydroxy-6-hydroxymethyldihydropteridine diphosphokinase [Phycisphaerae bacterium]HRY67026.1 2-amino-4-hydroxy-6-hydroxymethyldihydropteridine diphosphokinase [Phycisphaerae bacterium]HSA27723.1 2-amino-4-hydroxy-6-hydroxymethyldihydropteridine diphosphokinase [Phycisphaerae bacterium]